MTKEMLLEPVYEDTFSFYNCMKDLVDIIESEIIMVKFDRFNKRLLFRFGMLFAHQNYLDSNKKIVLPGKLDRLPYKEFDNVFLDMMGDLPLLPPYNIKDYAAFMISPVRVTTDPLAIYLRKYKEDLLKKGIYEIVHYPFDDTGQSDPIGTTICRTNLDAEANSETILIWYKKDSRGSVFDLGMDFMLKYYLDDIMCPGKHRKFKLINPNDLKGDGYERFLLEIVDNQKDK